MAEESRRIPTVEELRERAYASVAQYPQYAAPYFEGWVRVYATEMVTTKGGVAMEADDVLLARFGKIESAPTRLDDDQWVVIWTHHPRYCLDGGAVAVPKRAVRVF